MARSPRYRQWPVNGTLIDWRQPLQYVLDQFAREITTTIVPVSGSPRTETFAGFSLTKQPTAVPREGRGPGVDGIAWEFTGQVVAAAKFLDDIEGTTGFRDDICGT